jgi:D-alanine-D-alanine ligase-like ATP-grasp enzyme
MFLVAFHKLAILYRKVLQRMARRGAAHFVSEKSADSRNKMIICGAARRLGVTVRELPHQYVELKFEGRTCYSISSDLSFESLVAYKMCGNKLVTSTLLEENGLPVPKFKGFDRREFAKAREYLSEMSAPAVVKPCSSTSSGDGIGIAVSGQWELANAFAKALCYSNSIMVEQYIEGESFRLTVLGGELITVIRRLPAYVTGDGISSVRELIVEKNDAYASKSAETRLIRPITVDTDVRSRLRSEGLTLRSVPDSGQVIHLRRISNASQGGEIQDVTDRCHPDYKQLAISAAKIMGASLAGVDIIAHDIAAPFQEGRAVINEVNTTPGLAIVREPDLYGGIDTTIGEEILRHAFGIA